MSRIAVVLTKNIYTDVRVYKESSYLAQKGHDVEVFCLDRKNEFVSAPSARWKGFSIRFFSGRTKRLDEFLTRHNHSRILKNAIYLYWFFRYIWQIKKYISKASPEYIHCHDLDGIAAGVLAAGRKIPLIFDMHEFYEMQSEFAAKKRYLIRLVVNFFINKSYRIVYVHEQQKTNVPKQNLSKYIFLPNYPDLSNLMCVKKTVAAVLRINYIGNVRGQLGMFKILFDACRGLDEVEIRIYGGGDDYSALKNMEKSYSNVFIMGRYDGDRDMPQLYASTDILYLAYNDKNTFLWRQPVKFFEALATLTPVIAYESAFVGEFSKDHLTGFAVDIYSADAVRALIMDILADRNKLDEVSHNIRNVQTRFNWDEVVKNLDLIYG